MFPAAVPPSCPSVQRIAYRLQRYGSCLARRQFVGADEVGKFFRVGFSYGGIFIVTMCLAGDDLPIAVALKPRVSDVITRFQILAEYRLISSARN